MIQFYFQFITENLMLLNINFVDIDVEDESWMLLSSVHE